MAKKAAKRYISFMKRVEIKIKAHKQIAKLSKQEMREIYEALAQLENWPDVPGVKALRDMPGYRLRIGRYRALFEVSGDLLTITEVKIRNERTY